MSTAALTLYFDGHCPLCAAGMARLRRWDVAGRLDFVDIAVPDFDPMPLGVSMTDLNRELHSLTASGKVLIGIDSLLAAYTLVDKGWPVMPLNVPFLRRRLIQLYRSFARNRYRISRWLGYQPVPACDGAVCHAGNPFLMS